MKSYNSRELIKEAKKRGFVLIRVNGSHHIFKIMILEPFLIYLIQEMGSKLEL